MTPRRRGWKARPGGRVVCTTVALGATAPWTSSTPGQLNTTSDVDYLTLTVPQAGVLVVETSGSTATVGMVWQGGVELPSVDSGGERQNSGWVYRYKPGRW